MKRFYFVGFLLLAAFDTLAQTCFKLAGEHALPVAPTFEWLARVFGQVWVYGAVAGYIGAFFCWMSLLSRAPIGPAFAASHLEVVSVMFVSYWLFDEALTPLRLAAALAILAGIVCLAVAEGRLNDEAAANSGTG